MSRTVPKQKAAIMKSEVPLIVIFDGYAPHLVTPFSRDADELTEAICVFDAADIADTFVRRLGGRFRSVRYSQDGLIRFFCEWMAQGITLGAINYPTEARVNHVTVFYLADAVRAEPESDSEKWLVETEQMDLVVRTQ
jgi:hypothetical protein